MSDIAPHVLILIRDTTDGVYTLCINLEAVCSASSILRQHIITQMAANVAVTPVIDFTEFSQSTALAMIDYILTGHLKADSVNIVELSHLACQLQMNTLVIDILTSLRTVKPTTLPSVTSTYTSLKLPAVCVDDCDQALTEYTSCELTVALECVTKSLSTATCSLDEPTCSPNISQSPQTPTQTTATTPSKSRRTLMKVHEAIRIETSADETPWARNKKYIVKLDKGYMCNVCNKVFGRYNSVSYHVTIYHRNEPINCGVDGCTFSTREARYMHFHRLYKHSVPLPQNVFLSARRCEYCHHLAKSPAMLRKHLQRHRRQFGLGPNDPWPKPDTVTHLVAEEKAQNQLYLKRANLNVMPLRTSDATTAGNVS